MIHPTRRQRIRGPKIIAQTVILHPINLSHQNRIRMALVRPNNTVLNRDSPSQASTSIFTNNVVHPAIPMNRSFLKETSRARPDQNLYNTPCRGWYSRSRADLAATLPPFPITFTQTMHKAPISIEALFWKQKEETDAAPKVCYPFL
jgi:hypothetical protein